MDNFVILYAMTIFILIYDSWNIGVMRAQLEIIRKELAALKGEE